MEDRKREDVERVLTEEILADAHRRAERTVKRAEREGEKLLDQVLKEAEAVRGRVLRRAQERVGRERQLFSSSLLLEERTRRLKVQGDLLEEVFDQALERLRDRTRFDYHSVVKALAVEGVLAMTGEAFVLRVAESDLKSMRDKLPGEVRAGVKKESGRRVNVELARQGTPIEGGIIVESADGRQRFDNSLAARVGRMKDELRFDVAEILFGPSDKAATPVKETPR